MTGPADRLNGFLSERAHVCTIITVVVLAVLYLMHAHRTAPGQPPGDLVQFLVAAVGLVGGLIALVYMATLKGSDFGKLASFQAYIVLGMLLGTALNGLAILHAFGL